MTHEPRGEYPDPLADEPREPGLPLWLRGSFVVLAVTTLGVTLWGVCYIAGHWQRLFDDGLACTHPHDHDRQLRVLDTDRAVLLTLDDFSRVADIENETLGRVHLAECAAGISYAYLSPTCAVESAVQWRGSVSKARREFRDHLASRPVTAEAPNAPGWGDECALWFETRAGEPFGCVFVGRREATVVRARWNGSVFEPAAPAELWSFLVPRVERMATYGTGD